MDYGLAHLYVSSGEHKPFKEDPRSKHNGTLEFTSIDAHKGVGKWEGFVGVILGLFLGGSELIQSLKIHCE